MYIKYVKEMNFVSFLFYLFILYLLSFKIIFVVFKLLSNQYCCDFKTLSIIWEATFVILCCDFKTLSTIWEARKLQLIILRVITREFQNMNLRLLGAAHYNFSHYYFKVEELDQIQDLKCCAKYNLKASED